MDILELQIKAYSNNLTTLQVERIMSELRPHVFHVTDKVVGKPVAIAITVIEPKIMTQYISNKPALVQATAHQTDEPIELLDNENTD